MTTRPMGIGHLVVLAVPLESAHRARELATGLPES
jgi:hypothetical protein